MNEEDENKNENQDQEVEKISLGDKEYTQDELNSMVGVATQVKELEEKYNTKLDRVWPEYTKKSQRLKELEEENEKLKSSKTENKPNVDGASEDQIKAARDAAKKIGLLTQDQFSEMMSKHFREFYSQEREVDQRVSEGRKLEKDLDGSDGRPKFDMQDMASWMKENNYGNLPFEKAYKLRYESELDKWKEKNLSSAQSSGMSTMRGSEGTKKPKPVKVTRDNIDQLIDDTLSGNY